MKNVPEMISTKDSAYIKDMFNWNFVAMKKFDNYIENVEDEEIVKKLNNLADMHFQNCNTLIKLLEGEINE
mgnify:FL=1